MNTEHRRIALITGANKGIGYEVARQLAKQGFAVFLGAREHQLGYDAAATLCAEGYDVTYLLLDVCDPVSITNAMGVFSQKADHLDVLVNNAAILEHEGMSIVNLNVESLNRTMQTNVNGPILVTQFFLSFLEKAPTGARVINVSSSAGSLATMQTYAHLTKEDQKESYKLYRQKKEEADVKRRQSHRTRATVEQNATDVARPAARHSKPSAQQT